MKPEKKVILVIGKRGTGKSYLVDKLINNCTRLIVYDPQSEYDGGVVFDLDHYQDFIRFLFRYHKANFRIIYRPINPEAEIDDIAKLVFALGNLTLVVEEIEAYCSSHSINMNLMAILARGRHKNIDLIGVTQRPFGIHRYLTSQAKTAYVFRTNEPADRDYLKNLLGSEIEPLLDQLKEFEHIVWQEHKEGFEIKKA